MTANGKAPAAGLGMGPVVNLGSLSYERRAIIVERNGEPVTLWVWVEGKGCAGYVKARVERARLAYRALTSKPVLDDSGEPVIDEETGEAVEIFQNDPEAWDAYLRDTLMAVVDGLAYTEAEVLSGLPAAMNLLRAHGWVRQAAEAEDDADPEASREEPTTAESSRPSQPATGSRRRRS